MKPTVGPLVLVANASKEGAAAIAESLADQSRQIGLDARTVTEFPFPENFLRGARLAVVIGGDGTLLSVVPHALVADVPLAGFNLGKLGFLTNFSVENAAEQLQEIIDGRHSLQARQILAITDATGTTDRGLNDVVLRTTSTRLATLAVSADGRLVNRYYCDGLIFATPTGSTAYNLSADGPIIHPEASVIGMTPICPHTLSNRSLVLDGRTEITVDLIEPGADCLSLAVDGRSRTDCTGLFPITIRLSDKPLRLVHPAGFDFFDVLRNKLRWGD